MFNFFKNKFGRKKKVTEPEHEPESFTNPELNPESNGPSGPSGYMTVAMDNTEPIDTSIFFVYIRMHGSLIIIDKKKKKTDKIEKSFEKYKIPDDMILHKITSAPNGSINESHTGYDSKNKIIEDTIEIAYNEKKEPDISYISVNIAFALKEAERQIEPPIQDVEDRTILSMNKTVLNKGLNKYKEESIEKIIKTETIKEYKPILIFRYNTNKKIFTEIPVTYEDIYSYYKSHNKGKQYYDINTKKPIITTKDLIEFLYNALNLRNVILMDFSCSSIGKDKLTDTEKQDLLEYANKHNYHGGNYKLNSIKNKKKTKKNKSKSNNYKNNNYKNNNYKNNRKTKKYL